MITILRSVTTMLILALPILPSCIVVNGVENVIHNSKSKYIEPSSGQTANVRTFFSSNQIIRIYPNSMKRSEIKKDKDGGTVATNRFISGFDSIEFVKKSLGMPFSPENRIFAEHKVIANKPFIISMAYVSSEQKGNYTFNYRCRNKYILVNFEPNKNYGVDMNTTNKRCNYRIFEYLPDGKEKLITDQKLAP